MAAASLLALGLPAPRSARPGIVQPRARPALIRVRPAVEVEQVRHPSGCAQPSAPHTAGGQGRLACRPSSSVRPTSTGSGSSEIKTRYEKSSRTSREV